VFISLTYGGWCWHDQSMMPKEKSPIFQNKKDKARPL